MKAISAIIATIMLLMISVSLISVFYVFSSTLTTQTTSSGTEQVSQLTKQLSYCMQIDSIYKNQVTLRNCGKGVIENRSLVVMMDDVVLGASTQTILEGNSSVVNISGLWQIPFGKHSLKISNGATVAQNLVEVQPNKDGLVGSWNFDEGSGNKANDGSGNNNIGTLLPSGSEPVWTSGKFGKGLQFDGVNDYVDAGNANTFNFRTGDFATALWVRFSSPYYTRYNHLLEFNAYTDGWMFFYNSDTSDLEFYINGNPFQIMPTLLPPNEWHYIVATRESGVMKMFKDGILLGSKSMLYDINPLTKTLHFANINQDGKRFSGTIDEVRIWSKALAPDETVTMKQLI